MKDEDTPRHILIKLIKISDKEKIFKKNKNTNDV